MIKIKKLANALNSMVVPPAPLRRGASFCARTLQIPLLGGVKGWVGSWRANGKVLLRSSWRRIHPSKYVRPAVSGRVILFRPRKRA